MISRILKKQVAGFGDRYGYDIGYMQDLVDTDRRGAVQLLLAGAFTRRRFGLPAAPYFAAKITATRHADCGSCLKLAIDMAVAQQADQEAEAEQQERGRGAAGGDSPVAARHRGRGAAGDGVGGPVRPRGVGQRSVPARGDRRVHALERGYKATTRKGIVKRGAERWASRRERGAVRGRLEDRLMRTGRRLKRRSIASGRVRGDRFHLRGLRGAEGEWSAEAGWIEPGLGGCGIMIAPEQISEGKAAAYGVPRLTRIAGNNLAIDMAVGRGAAGGVASCCRHRGRGAAGDGVGGPVRPRGVDPSLLEVIEECTRRWAKRGLAEAGGGRHRRRGVVACPNDALRSGLRRGRRTSRRPPRLSASPLPIGSRDPVLDGLRRRTPTVGVDTPCLPAGVGCDISPGRARKWNSPAGCRLRIRVAQFGVRFAGAARDPFARGLEDGRSAEMRSVLRRIPTAQPP